MFDFTMPDSDAYHSSFSFQERPSQFLSVFEYRCLLQHPQEFYQWCSEIAFSLENFGCKQSTSSAKENNSPTMPTLAAENLAEFARQNFDRKSEARWKAEPWVRLLSLPLQQTLAEIFLVGVTLDGSITRMAAQVGDRGRQICAEEYGAAGGQARIGTAQEGRSDVASQSGGKGQVASLRRGSGHQVNVGEGQVPVMEPGILASDWDSSSALPTFFPSLAPPLPGTQTPPGEMQRAPSRQKHITFHCTSGRPQVDCGPSSQAALGAGRGGGSSGLAICGEETRLGLV